MFAHEFLATINVLDDPWGVACAGDGQVRNATPPISSGGAFQMDFIADLSAIEAIIRRHVPTLYRVEAVELASHDVSSGNPAPFRVIVSIRRVVPDPDPGGWGHSLASEIRAGWDSVEFALAIKHLPSEFEEITGQYGPDKES